MGRRNNGGVPLILHLDSKGHCGPLPSVNFRATVVCKRASWRKNHCQTGVLAMVSHILWLWFEAPSQPRSEILLADSSEILCWLIPTLEVSWKRLLKHHNSFSYPLIPSQSLDPRSLPAGSGNSTYSNISKIKYYNSQVLLWDVCLQWHFRGCW